MGFSRPFFLLAVCSGLAGATDLCGMLYMPTTLSKDRSPYRIIGDIYVPPASRLTIEAGVEIVVAAKDSCEQDLKQLDWSDSQYVSIKVDGAFFVKGTPESPVIIRPEHPQQGKVLWDGLRVHKQDPGAAQIQCLHISGANHALQAERTSFPVENCIFEGNNTGIFLGEKANLQITNNLFVHNTSAGVFLQFAAPDMIANIFYENPNYGVWADSRKGVKVENNLFWKNGEANCWHCPATMGKRKGTDAQSDSIDAAGNLYADPVFMGTQAEAEYKRKDKFEPTPAADVVDSTLATRHHKADSLGKAGLAPRPVFIPSGAGKWRLSQYSPALDAAPDKKAFLDANGTRGDIGPWGATAKYSK